MHYDTAQMCSELQYDCNVCVDKPHFLLVMTDRARMKTFSYNKSMISCGNVNSNNIQTNAELSTAMNYYHFSLDVSPQRIYTMEVIK